MPGFELTLRAWVEVRTQKSFFCKSGLVKGARWRLKLLNTIVHIPPKKPEHISFSSLQPVGLEKKIFERWLNKVGRQASVKYDCTLCQY
jgi:hypothetical protein